MKHSMKAVLIGVALAMVPLGVIGWVAHQANGARPEPAMARLMPQGAVLFLEAKDLAGLLRDWSASPEKQAWLSSDNFQVFSRSRLLLRLQQVQGEFAAAAGIPPNMNFLAEIAGGQSVLGIYDIGKLELLYITRLPSGRVMQTALWQKRAQFEPREVAGRQFFVRTDPQSGRVVAFAVTDDHLLLATREDLMAGALTLLAGQKLATLAEENWFATTIQAGKTPGDLRMAIHIAKVSHTPQFRTYWVQRNISEMQQYEATLADLYRSPAEYREERVLFGAAESQAPAKKDEVGGSTESDERAVADLLRLVPPEAGVYRAFAAPPMDTLLASLERKVLTPRMGSAPPSKVAPNVSLGGGAVGSEADLETRIDAPPPTRAGGWQTDEALKVALGRANVRATLQLHRSEASADGVFVRLRSTIVLSAASDWDEAALRSAVQQLVAPGVTTGGLGVAWKPAANAGETYSELDGLGEIAMATRRKYLIVSNDPAMLVAVLRRVREPASAEPAYYAAGFNHARERQNFYRLTSLADQPNRGGTGGSEARVPEFFSQNVASLSQALAGVESQSVIIRRTGAQETQTVRYRWSH